MIQIIESTKIHTDTLSRLYTSHIVKNIVDFYIRQMPYNNNGIILLQLTALIVEVTDDTEC
jgi:hypothetical protein